MRSLVSALALGGALAATAALGAPSGAAAADGTIDHISTSGSQVEVLYSLPGLTAGATPDASTASVTLDGDPAESHARLASDVTSVERVTMLAIDTSRSMAGEPFDAARAAAMGFIDQAPRDVSVGVVAFADDATLVSSPTTDRDVLRDAVAGLTLTRATRLYDGIGLALETLSAGVEGRVIVLTDGRDTSGKSADAIVAAVEASPYRVDVLALRQSGTALATLQSIVTAGRGSVTNTDDPAGLTALFAEQARILGTQMLVRLSVPKDFKGGDTTLSVSVEAGGETYTDAALVRLPAADDPATTDSTEPIPVDAGFSVSEPLMIAGLVIVALGVVLVIALMTGALGPKKATVVDRLAPYGAGGGGEGGRGRAATAETSVVAKTVDATDRALQDSRLDVKLANKLDAAGMTLNSAEWLLLHTGIATGGGLAAFMLTGNVVWALVALLVGALGPWLYLSRKASKRIKAFGAQLADTLQLISGSLSAGLSLPQSFDTVVREGNDPVAGEFRRALVEQRLGVEVESALDGVAQRMESPDFAWVVMAIRIQRNVGGNLAELLLTVAGTLRERDYLRRQVRTLSAEGRMSAWVLGGLPPLFFVYLMLVQPDYLQPMLTEPMGWMMLGAAGIMMTIGVVMMNQMVKVEV